MKYLDTAFTILLSLVTTVGILTLLLSNLKVEGLLIIILATVLSINHKLGESKCQ